MKSKIKLLVYLLVLLFIPLKSLANEMDIEQKNRLELFFQPCKV